MIRPRRTLPFALLALAASSLPCGAPAQPAVPLDDLDAPSRSEDRLSSAPEFLFADGSRVSSGWALMSDPGRTIEVTLSGGGDPNAALGEFENEALFESRETLRCYIPGGWITRRASGSFLVRLPAQPGNASLRVAISREIRSGGGAAAATDQLDASLTFLLRAPFDRNGNGSIDGYPIGIYPTETAPDAPATVAAHPELYAPPKFFILVTPEVEPLQISPRYHLRDFIARGEAGRKHWIALDPRLVEFLESATGHLETQLGKSQSPCPLRPLVAFLSPNHLAQLRAKSVNFALFARFQYGDGATLIWDADGDGRMDDLIRDGRIDLADAETLAEKLAELQKRLGKFGGIGAAGNSKMPGVADTPVVDLDMRGVASRW